jgi:patatin-like phospholipase/acyl hydrolase
MRKVRLIVAIDGGGIRGLIPLCILNRIAEGLLSARGLSLHERIDLVAGTSTGAIISAALILKNENEEAAYASSDLIELYKHRGHQIFSKDRTDHVAPLQLVLESGFGDATMKSLSKQFVFVCYDEKLDNAFVFHNELKMYRNVPLTRLLQASCAIQPYFNPVDIGGKLLSDGMNAAKNPAEIALNFARCYFPNDVILLLSLGTGELDENDEVEQEVKRIEAELNHQSIGADDFMYYRLNPPLVKASTAMDDTSPQNILHLIADAEAYLDANPALMKKLLQNLL